MRPWVFSIPLSWAVSLTAGVPCPPLPTATGTRGGPFARAACGHPDRLVHSDLGRYVALNCVGTAGELTDDGSRCQRHRAPGGVAAPACDSAGRRQGGGLRRPGHAERRHLRGAVLQRDELVRSTPRRPGAGPLPP